MTTKSNSIFDFFENYMAIILLILTAFSFFISLKFDEEYYLILIPIFFFLLYDLWFRFYKNDNWKAIGRSSETTLASVRAAIQHTAILLGFMGVVIGDLMKSCKIKYILNMFSESKILQIYAYTVVIIAALILLFVPVVYAIDNKDNTVDEKNVGEKQYHDKEKEPADALKNYYMFIIFLQKALIILALYLVLIGAKYVVNLYISHQRMFFGESFCLIV